MRYKVGQPFALLGSRAVWLLTCRREATEYALYTDIRRQPQGRKRVSIRIMAQVWETPLTPTEKLVLLALADCANDTGECWPSIATIGRKAGVGERTVQRSIQSMKDAGHLTRKEVTGRGCRYYIHPRHVDTPAELTPPPQTTEPPPQWHPTPATVAPKPSLNHKEPSKRKTNSARAIPDDWTPEPFDADSKCAAIIDSWPQGELETQVEHFTSHHRSKGSRFVAWQDAWKTWVLNSRKWNNGKSIWGTGEQDRRSSRARAIDEAVEYLGP